MQKAVGGGSPIWYVGGSDGKTDVVYAGATSNPCYNIFGANGLVGQAKRTGAALNRSYHLKDHLGSVRVTVGSTMIVDNFSSDLSQWTTVLGSGYAVESGELSASAAGGDNVLVNSSTRQITDGTIGVDVKLASGTAGDPSLIVRYQDVNNYYMVSPYWNMLTIYKKAAGTYNLIQTVGLPGGTMAAGTWYHVQIAVSGSNLKVSWNGQQLISWTDPSGPFLTGKVGFRQCVSRHVHWDNYVAIGTGTGTAPVIAYDDYYPFGQSMDLRCWNNGFGDARYKYTEKERDSETGYDYFGARCYDARVGRFLSLDQHGFNYPSLSHYSYSANSPIRLVDPTGMDLEVYINGNQADQATDALRKESSLQISRDKETGKLTATGEAKTDADKKLKEAIDDTKVAVHLTATSETRVKSKVDGGPIDIVMGAYDGSKKQGERIETSQFINMDHVEKAAAVAGEPGKTVMHEVLESYTGGVQSPGQPYSRSSFQSAHDEAMKVLPLPPIMIQRIWNPTTGVTKFGVCRKEDQTNLIILYSK